MEDAAAASWIAGLNDIKTLYELGCFPEDTLTAGDERNIKLTTPTDLLIGEVLLEEEAPLL